MLELVEEDGQQRQTFGEQQNVELADGNKKQQSTGAAKNEEILAAKQQQTLFFDGKLRIFNGMNLNDDNLGADVLVNFCASDILSGDEIFLNIHELAGEELKNFAARYQGLGIGSCRLSDAFGLKNFKKVAHCILPRPILSEDLNDLDALVEFDLVLCYRNALDLSMEAFGSGISILFNHPLLYADRLGVAKLAVATLSLWMERSPYADRLQQITIACPNDEIAQLYVQTLGELAQRSWEEFVLSNSNTLCTFLLESFDANGGEGEFDGLDKFDDDFDQLGPSTSAASLNRPSRRERVICLKQLELPEYNEAPAEMQMLEAIFEREFAPLEFVEEQQIPFEGGTGTFGHQKKRNKKQMLPFDENEDPNLMAPYENPNLNQFCIERYGFDEMYIREHPDEVYDMLFRSPDGLQLQLSRNLSATILTIEEEQGGMLRQYRMTTQNREGETLYFRCSRCESLMRYTMDEYRPKITVKDGFIYGDCYPMHHPQCYPVTREWVILQQLDRQARLQMFQSAQWQQQQQMKIQEGDDGGMVGAEEGGGGIVVVNEGEEEANLEGAMAVGDGGVVAPSGVEYATVKQFLTGGQQYHRNQGGGANLMKQEMGDRSNAANLAARTRLRPAVNESAKFATAMGPSIGRRLPISVATPRYNVVQRTPNDVPILYRRREAPENATLRAIRKCENELEGRGANSDEMLLDRSLLMSSTQAENIDFWKSPLAPRGPSSYVFPSARYLAPPMAPAVIPPSVNGRHRQMDGGELMELGHEEIVIDHSPPQHRQIGIEREEEEEEQIIGNAAAQQSSFLHSEGGRRQLANGGTGRRGRPPKHQQQQQMAAGTSGSGGGQEKRQNAAAGSTKNPADGGGRLQRKFRMIRKRGGKTGMAFDWREADFGDAGMEEPTGKMTRN